MTHYKVNGNIHHCFKKRKYHESYIEHGFTSIITSKGEEKPQCVVCGDILSIEAMKPNKMKGHLTSCHPEHANKNWIKRRALNNRLFRQLCQEMGADHEVLLYHLTFDGYQRGKC